MKIFILFIISVFSGLTHAQECHPTTLDQVGDLFKSVLSNHAPTLLEKKIPLKIYHSAAYFLQATVLPGPLLLGKKSYRLDVGQRLLECPPSESALRSIILHESQHFLDYERMSAVHVAGLGKNYLLSKKFRIRYERATDLKVLESHEGEGLIDYRVWLYERLNPKQLAVKRATYLTPEEINEWLGSHN